MVHVSLWGHQMPLQAGPEGEHGVWNECCESSSPIWVPRHHWCTTCSGSQEWESTVYVSLQEAESGKWEPEMNQVRSSWEGVPSIGGAEEEQSLLRES